MTVRIVDRLRRAAAALLLSLLPPLPAAAEAERAAEIFALPSIDGEITAPAGFTPLPKHEILQKYPYRDPPFFVLGNDARTTTIAVNLHSHEISNENLGAAQSEFETLLERMTPGLRWHRREIVELVGRRWILLEFTSHAIDTDIRNLLLITPRLGRMLIFNFNATEEEFARVEQSLRDSMQTIVLR